MTRRKKDTAIAIVKAFAKLQTPRGTKTIWQAHNAYLLVIRSRDYLAAMKKEEEAMKMKRCPACRNSRLVGVRTEIDNEGNTHGRWGNCWNCDFNTGPAARTKRTAIKRWNAFKFKRRPKP